MTRAKKATDVSHHERRCSVCRHPDCEAIEEEFVHWHSLAAIEHGYRIDRRSVYRHAHAFGLFEIRAANIRFALGHLISQAQGFDPTADSIVRAVHAFARINSSGQ